MKAYVESLGIIAPKAVYRNLTPAELTERAVARGEGSLSDTGALVVTTGKYTGRSPNDRFVVDTPSIHDDIDWGKVNVPISPERFEQIYGKMMAYLQGREIFIFDGFAGADEQYHLPVRVVNELASQNMFIHQLLVRPTEEQLRDFVPGFTIIAAPGFKCIPERDGVNSEAAILVNFDKKMVLIAGSQYAGEIKKSIFSVMNYVLPKQGLFTMHCSANIGKDGTARCSSASPAPARRPSRPTRTASSSATTSTPGPTRASSTSRAAATPSASTSPGRTSRRSGTRSSSAHWSRTSSWTPRRARSTLTTARSPRTPAWATPSPTSRTA